MGTPPSSEPRDHSIANASGASQNLFPSVPYASITERFIFNPNASGDIWVNIFGDAAAANTAGSFSIAPGQGWSGAVTGEINVVAALNADITAGER